MHREQQLIELERYLHFVDESLNLRAKRVKAAEEQWELEEYFPHLLLTTVFVTLYAIIEASMNAVCNRQQKALDLTSGVEEVKGSGIQRAATYLNKVCKLNFPDSGNLWHQLLAYNRLRNVIMHALGKPESDDKQFCSFVQDNPNLHIDESGKIVLRKEFCLDAISDARELFRLLDNLEPKKS